MKTIGIIGQNDLGIAVREEVLSLPDKLSVVAYDINEPNDIVVYSGSEGFRQYGRRQPLKDILDLSDGPILVCAENPVVYVEPLNVLGKGRNVFVCNSVSSAMLHIQEDNI